MPQKKLTSIQALRGIAALYVALFHLPAITFYPTVNAPSWLGPLVTAGMSGVSLFFVISAFTLCLSANSHANESKPVIDYYLRRIFRIAPLFYIWIVLACLRDHYIMHSTHSIGEVLSNALFVFNFERSNVAGIPWAAWTIGVEMVFYVFFPFIFRLFDTIPKLLGLLAVTTATGIWWKVAHASDDTYAYFGFVGRLPIFVLGMLLYRVYICIRALDKSSSARLGYLLAIGGGLYFLAIAYYPNYRAVPLRDYQQAIAWAAIAFGLSLSSPKLLANKVFDFLGELSYSIYLSHATILHLLSYFGLFGFVQRLVGNGFLGFLGCYLVGLAVVLPFSWLTYKWIETPGNRYVKRLIDRRHARASSAPSPTTGTA